MELGEFIRGLAGRVYGMPDADITSTFFEGEGDKVAPRANALDLLLAKDVERIKTLDTAHKVELTSMHDQGHKKGLAESLDTWEKKLREEFKVDAADLKGVELVKAIVKSQAKTPPEKDVKLSPEYLALEKQLAENNTAWETKLKTETDNILSQYKKKETLSRVASDAQKILLAELKPSSLSATELIRQTQIQNFLRELEPFEYQIAEDGNHIISENGKRKNDPHGNPFSFKELVKDIAGRHFEFAQQPDRGNAGNGGGSASGGAPAKVPDEWGAFMTQVANEADPAKKKEMFAAWETAHPEKP